MRRTTVLLPLAALVVLCVAVAFVPRSRTAPPTPAAERKVKLAVLVVFDQLCPEYLERWRPLFRSDGFARLQRDGAWFVHCYYPYSGTFTGPGHASMLTGACPDVHGIVGNEWRENGRDVYCASHARYELIPPYPNYPPDEPDKKPRAAPKEAGTPELLLSETVGDVLKETHPRAKVFGLSIKDRSAILTTGKRPNGAYWFYGGIFGTSTYYSDGIHSWVAEFNQARFADQWFGQDWTRLRPDLDYTAWSGPDYAPGEGKGYGQGITFPHPTTGGKSILGHKYFDALVNSPYGNDLLLELTKKCIEEEKLGSREVPDLLVISFSSNDLIGHSWGPNSHEVLDTTLRSDAQMAQLLTFLDHKVGAGRYLLAVTADHGVCPLPEQIGLPGARRIDTSQLKSELDEHLNEVFANPEGDTGRLAKWIDSFAYPWIHLNQRVVQASGWRQDQVAAEAARFLAHRPGVARTFVRTELAAPVADSDTIGVLAKRSYYPSRCGDVMVVLDPFCLPAAPLSSGTTHGSPYAYDRHVPLLVYGPGIRGAVRREPTTPQAIASIFAKGLELRLPRDAAFPVPETLGD